MGEPRRRTDAQDAYAAAAHEAAHVVMADEVGRADAIRRVWIRRPGDRGVPDADFGGRVEFDDTPVGSLADAIDDVCIALAGGAGMRAAWALEMIADDDIGGRPRALTDLDDDELLDYSNNGGGTRGAIAAAQYDPSGSNDEDGARRTVERFAQTPEERAAMLLFCRARTTRIVTAPAFQARQALLTAALLDHYEMDGDHVRSLLSRGAVLAGFGHEEED